MFEPDTIGLVDTLLEKSVDNYVPLRAIFELTYRCNFACDFCYMSPLGEPELSFAECQEVIDGLKTEGCLFLTLTGGEPLTRRDFFEIAEYARSKCMALEVKTNGMLVTEEVAQRFKQLAVMNVDISIHGSTPEAHDAVTQRKGSFERVTNGIKVLKDRGIPVTIKSVLTQQNFHDRTGIKSLAQQMGCDCVFDLTVTARQDGDITPHKHKITVAEMEKFIEENEQDYLDSLRKCVTPRDLFDERPCYAGISTCSVNPYGEVYPCIQLPYSVGNIRHNTFGEIWRSSAALGKIRSVKIGDLSMCTSCPSVADCLRCPGLALLEDGDMLGPSMEACRQTDAYKRVKERHNKKGARV